MTAWRCHFKNIKLGNSMGKKLAVVGALLSFFSAVPAFASVLFTVIDVGTYRSTGSPRPTDTSFLVTDAAIAAGYAEFRYSYLGPQSARLGNPPILAVFSSSSIGVERVTTEIMGAFVPGVVSMETPSEQGTTTVDLRMTFTGGLLTNIFYRANYPNYEDIDRETLAGPYSSPFAFPNFVLPGTNLDEVFNYHSKGWAGNEAVFATLQRTSVPIPGVVALLAIGLAGFGFARRRFG
jgi:hypothetical protein